MKYAHGFYCGLLCCGDIITSWWIYITFLYIHILQGYFTGPGAIVRLPRASEINLKDMGKIDE